MQNSNSSDVARIIGIGLVILMVCCFCAATALVCGGGVWLAGNSGPRPTRVAGLTRLPTIVRTPGPVPTAIQATPQPVTVQPPADLWRDAVPPEALETQRLLESADIPERDLIDVTMRLKDPGVPIPTVVRDTPWNFKLGDTHDFWVSNEDTHEHFKITARLAYETPHVYIWVEEDVKLDQKKLERLTDRFEEKTYPTDREFFGSELTPGVDSDPHLSILFAREMGDSVAGYYSSIDGFSHLVHEYSNEMEMFYINADNVRLDDPYYDCTLAHEFQHMIHWAKDRNETSWINEGFSELACLLNDLDVGGHEYYLAEMPDTQLTSWPDSAGLAGANYGASYLFAAYFLDRFGEEATRALVAEQENSVVSVDRVLQNLGTNLGFDDVFADWVVANYINNPNLADGRYGYTSISVPDFEVVEEYKAREMTGSQATASERAQVHQYATDYIELSGKGDFRIDFAGATLVGLAPIQAHSGKYLWWSGRVDNSDTTLTREFDLSGLSEATLKFWTWYDIEKDYDYAYVVVSTDGKKWTPLPGETTTNDNPTGANYGNGFNDLSDGWIQETVDLTPYAGQKVQVRFEYLTDIAALHAGMFIDDIEIPELGYHSDAEEGDGGWVARGFIRNAGVLPQEWLLQLVKQQSGQTTVERLQLGPDQTGSWAVSLGSNETAIFIVSGRTRVTTESAEYWYAITVK